MSIKFRHTISKTGKVLHKLKDISVKSGWFENARYSDNKPIAGIAAVQDKGAAINNPGGQPFFKDKEGNIIYVSKKSPFASRMAKTKPHTIVIPPRPFMKPSIEDYKEDFINQTKNISQLFLHGDISQTRGANMIGEIIKGNIRKAII